MESSTDTLRKDYETTKTMAWAVLASMAIAYPAVVEIVRMKYAPFEGFAPHSLDHLKEVFFIFAVLTLMAIRVTRNTLLKIKGKPITIEAASRKIKTANMATFTICEIPALSGLAFFLIGGLYQEFYLLLACSVLAMIIYFPKLNHWQVLAQARKTPTAAPQVKPQPSPMGNRAFRRRK